MKPALAYAAPSSVAAPVPHLAWASPRPEPRAAYAEMARAPRSRRLLLVGIAALHVLGLWGLSHLQDVKRTVAQVAPVVVRLIAQSEPPKPMPTTPAVLPDMKAPSLTLVDPPLIAVATAPAPSLVVAALPPPPPAPAVVQAAPAPVVVPVVAPPPAPTIKQIPASAVRYLKEPRWTVPLMSRRLRESGIVQLRVVVDARGLPREITLAKSSGFARLDAQALEDMRGARFVPQTENGQPVEWEVITPLSYEIDR
ncbi:MAG: energy transducer TonB [Rubrivivax sp.]|nr:MAG: energy transducer TonB [Rubrivivax sp.]